MCQACVAKKRNWTFANGKQAKLHHHRLYRIYQGRTANVRLCRLCSIELFMLGENRFLVNNPALARQMAVERHIFASNN